MLAIASIGWALTRPAGPARRRGIVWSIAISAGIAVAAILLLIPRAVFFEPDARDACAELGAEYVGLATTGGRYPDPVPEGVRCVTAADPATTEVSVDFFASSEPLDAILAWLYRLACLLAPIATGLVIGFRLSRAPAVPSPARANPAR